MQFANPAALYALLALPVIIAIHFLQQRSRRVRVSTLFLLDHATPISVAGARFERLRNSLPLWLQLLAACLITWLLAEPRWLRENSRQTIAVVLDSSISMSAFQAHHIEPALARSLGPWARTAQATDWLLMESDTRKPVLYRGTELSPLLAALAGWQPTRGTHDPAEALLLARSLVKAAGTVLFVTDRKPPTLPSDLGIIAIGEPFANVGFVGAEIKPAGADGQTSWSVLVRNHSQEPQTREWWIEWPLADATAHAPISKTPFTLSPGQTLTLSGALPTGQDRAVLRLSPDRFSIDDAFPFFSPQPKRLSASITLADPAQRDLFTSLLSALDHLDLQTASGSDLVLSEIGTATSTHAIQISGSEGVGTVASLDPSPVLTEHHPLTRDLDWASLLTPAPTGLTLSTDDQPLLWKGNRPLALLRQDTQDDGRITQRLLLGWNPLASSAARNPAMVILLHRFIEDLRQRKRSFYTANFETDQPLPLAFPAKAPRTLLTEGKPTPFRNRTPTSPGFFEVQEGNERLLAAAATFGDPREADFTSAENFDNTANLRRQSALKQTEADPFTPLWLLVLGGCLLLSWRRP
jgi:hypothetical protein